MFDKYVSAGLINDVIKAIIIELFFSFLFSFSFNRGIFLIKLYIIPQIPIMIKKRTADIKKSSFL